MNADASRLKRIEVSISIGSTNIAKVAFLTDPTFICTHTAYAEAGVIRPTAHFAVQTAHKQDLSEYSKGREGCP